MWGSGPRGNNAACLAFSQILVTSPASHKHSETFWCWFLVVWACVHSRTPWTPPTDSSVRLGVSPDTATATYFYSQRFWGFISLHWNPGFRSLSHSLVVPPRLSTLQCGTTWSSSHCLAACHLCLSCPSPPLLLVCEWFFFNSLVVGLPYSSIFWQFWLFFVFKFVVVLLLVVQVGKVYLPTTPSWLVVIFVASLSPCFIWMDKSWDS